MMKWLEQLGWVTFTIGCIVFVVVGVRDGDWLVTIGSALFLVGVLALWVAFSDRE